MKAYLIELRDSDGNDCSVDDILVEAESPERALDKAWEYVKETWPEDEEDGGFGTYHPCDCECEHATTTLASLKDRETPITGVCDDCRDSWECSHGGVLLSEEPEEYETVAQARAAHATYHGLVDLT